ncbi:MAG: hypothetical protein HY893_07435 [Deltaproteobacteria bacterium]|nr:hypothetical protein [Deltaproteobacteria bacterium]
MRKVLLAAAPVVLLVLAAAAFAITNEEVPRITVQELKARLDRGEGITVVDVRSPGSYNSSKVRIKGAIRISPEEIRPRAYELPMGKEIVLYCT